MDKKYTVYMHTNRINHKVYVGITSRKVRERWQNGSGYLRKMGNGNYCQPKFANAILKYGIILSILFGQKDYLMMKLAKQRDC